MAHEGRGACVARPLKWGEALDEDFDVVLMCDVWYSQVEPVMDEQVASVAALLGPQGEVWCFAKDRGDGCLERFRAAYERAGFNVAMERHEDAGGMEGRTYFFEATSDMWMARMTRPRTTAT